MGAFSGILDQTLDAVGRLANGPAPEPRVEEFGAVTYIGSGIARVTGLPGVQSEELIEFEGGRYGTAFNLDPDCVGVILLDDCTEIESGSEVRRTHRVLDTPVGDALLGRVIDPLGRPLDDGGPVKTHLRAPIECDAPSILDRLPVTVPLATGTKVIDALIPIGRGQRQLILGDRQTGKSAIAVDCILNQKDQDVICIYCAIGRRSSSVAGVIHDLRARDAMPYSIVVVVSGDRPAGLQFAAPYAAMAMGEYFMRKGRDALIVFDDLTDHGVVLFCPPFALIEKEKPLNSDSNVLYFTDLGIHNKFRASGAERLKGSSPMNSVTSRASKAIACRFALSVPFLVHLGLGQQIVDKTAYQQIAFTLSSLSSDPIILMSPGGFIDPTVDPDDPSSRETLSLQLDRMLQPSLLYTQAPRNLGQLNLDVIQHAQWAKTPLLSPQRQQLTRLQAQLYAADGTPTAGYQRYLGYKKAYDDIAKVYSATPPDQITPDLRQRFQQAEQNLSVLGRRAVYEPAENQYTALQNLASYKWRDADLQKLQSASSTDGNGVMYMNTTPSTVLNKIDSLAWTTFTVSWDQLQHPSGTPKYGDSISNLPATWWTFPSHGSALGACTLNLGAADVSIAFEALLITVQRPWFDPKLLASQAWRWPDGSLLVSTGEQDGNNGEDPLYPNSLILVRNITIKGVAVQHCLPALRAAARAGEPITFGPFALAGTLPNWPKMYIAPLLTSTSIIVPFPQLLALGASIVPKAPNPNLDYDWSSQ